MSERKKLKELIVYVGGAPYPACIDAHGTLRFKFNWCVKVAADVAAAEAERRRVPYAFPSREGADMNALSLRFQDPPDGIRPSLRQYAEYHMLIGYSVDGFCDLSAFTKLEVRTPQWTREGVRPWGPPRRAKKGAKTP